MNKFIVAVLTQYFKEMKAVKNYENLENVRNIINNEIQSLYLFIILQSLDSTINIMKQIIRHIIYQ